MRIPAFAGFVGFLLLFAVITLFSGFYTVNEGSRGVLLTNGKLTSIAQPGMAFKIPFIQSVRDISVRSEARVFDNLAVYTHDQQEVTVKASVTWRVPPTDETVAEVYTRFGSNEAVATRLIDRRVNEVLEKVFGQFTALQVSRERGRLGAEFADAIKAIEGPLTIESVQIENLSFTDAYETSIQTRSDAEVAVTSRLQVAKSAEIDARIKVIEAQAKADSQLATAKANAEAVRLQGEAEASAIKAKGDALKQNPDLIDLIKAERWSGILPTTMLPNGTVPFLDVAPAPTR